MALALGFGCFRWGLFGPAKFDVVFYTGKSDRTSKKVNHEGQFAYPLLLVSRRTGPVVAPPSLRRNSPWPELTRRLSMHSSGDAAELDACTHGTKVSKQSGETRREERRGERQARRTSASWPASGGSSSAILERTEPGKACVCVCVCVCVCLGRISSVRQPREGSGMESA